MVRPPVVTKLVLGLYSLLYSCTIALDGKPRPPVTAVRFRIFRPENRSDTID